MNEYIEPKYHNCGCELSKQEEGLSYCPDCRQDVLWPHKEHSFRRTDCYSLKRSIQCSCGFTISGYDWKAIEAQRLQHITERSNQ